MKRQLSIIKQKETKETTSNKEQQKPSHQPKILKISSNSKSNSTMNFKKSTSTSIKQNSITSNINKDVSLY